MPVDPGALQHINIANYFQLLRIFSYRRKSIVGFPFWGILLLWYRLSGLWEFGDDVVPPTMTKLPDNIIQFSNPSGLEMHIKLTPKYRIPVDTMIAMSNTSFFEDQSVIIGRQIREVIITKQTEFYMSLVSKDVSWDAFEFELTHMKSFKGRNASQRKTQNPTDANVEDGSRITGEREIVVTDEDEEVVEMTNVIRQLKTTDLICSVRPWKVSFVDEEAVHAGGPARELVTEITSLIFDPSTEVTVLTPNGREKKNEYIPIDSLLGKKLSITAPTRVLMNTAINYPKHVVALCYLLLLSINWLLMNDKLRGTDAFIQWLSNLMPKQLKLKHFMNLIDNQSNVDGYAFDINLHKA